MENLLQAQDRQTRLYNRGTRLRQFTAGDRYLYYFLCLVLNYSRSGKDPLWSHGEWGSSITRSNERIGGDACQIYHLNLLKRWNEGTSVGLAAIVSNEDDLGPEAALQNHRSLWSRGRSPFAAAAHRLGPVASRFCGCILTPARSHRPCTAPHRNAPRGSGAQAAPIAFRNTIKT